jgi:hypothetical protein
MFIPQDHLFLASIGVKAEDYTSSKVGNAVTSTNKPITLIFSIVSTERAKHLKDHQ